MADETVVAETNTDAAPGPCGRVYDDEKRGTGEKREHGPAERGGPRDGREVGSPAGEGGE